MSTDRWLHLDGTANSRDLGGLPTTDGGTTASGRVLRSDDLQDLSPADVRTLVEQFRVTEVVDLRTTAEILLADRGPLREVLAVTHRHVGLLPERGNRTDVFAAEVDDAELRAVLPADWGESVLPRQVGPGDEVEPPAVRSYLGYLTDSPDQVVAALRSLATGGPGATVVHCAAGEDRTGVVCALALAVAGVDAETIVADHAMTAEVIDAIVDRLAATSTSAEDMALPREQHTPRAEMMRRVLELVDQRWGGPPAWLEQHGLGPGEQAALRARLRS